MRSILLAALLLAGPVHAAAKVTITAEYAVKMLWNGEQISPAGGAQSLNLEGVEPGVHELQIVRMPGKKVLFEGTVAVADGQQVTAILSRGSLAVNSVPIGSEPEPARAAKAMRLAQGVAGAAATASAVNQGVSDAKDGLQGAQDAMESGESYHSETSMELNVSKQGVSFASETNTASAGPDGTQMAHSGVSSTAGAQGVSYGTSTGDVAISAEGVSGSAQETSVAVGAGGVAVTSSETTAEGTQSTSVGVAVGARESKGTVQLPPDVVVKIQSGSPWLDPRFDPQRSSVELREEAVTGLEDIPDATEIIVRVLQTDPEPAVQKRAWRVLRARWKRGTGEPAEHQAAAVWLIENGDTGLQNEAIRAMGEYGDDLALVQSQLDHAELKVQRAACVATAEIATRQEQPDLAKETLEACQERLTDKRSQKELGKLLEDR